ncbi:MAG: hypothetical protein K0S80_5167 [Neobacillus sp.]|nr:hypothetical protein [Neobacillus sp.]
MNTVTIEPINRKVDFIPYMNKVIVEVIRIHTDYHFLTFSQTTSVHKEV